MYECMYACVYVHVYEGMYVENRGQTQVLSTSVSESGFLAVQKLINSSKEGLARDRCLFKLINSCYSDGVIVIILIYHTLLSYPLFNIYVDFIS